MLVNIKINGRAIQADSSLTILQVAKQNGINIPTLCYMFQGETNLEHKPASCRICVVEVKGRRNSLVEIVNMAKEALLDIENQIVYVVHADALADAEFVAELVKKELNPKGVVITPMGPIIGVSTGPGTIAIYGKGKKVEIVGN